MKFIYILPIFMISLLLLSCENSSTPPNVILILTDDQGYGDLSRNKNQLIQTPHLDQLFDRGATVSNFYVSPVCAPTRASILTGRYYQRTGVHGVTRGRERMNVQEETMGDVFQDAGYSTGVFGKWHNGGNYPYHPLFRGFDFFTGFTSGHYTSYIDAPIQKNGKTINTRGYLPDIFTDEAIGFIAQASKDNKPFFCFLTYQTPHTPLHVPDSYFNKYIEKGIDDFTAALYGMVDNIDYNLGRLIDAINQMKLEENTIIVFLSDNGPLTYRYNMGLKGKKGMVDEGGVRVPFNISWKGHIGEGIQLDQSLAHIDLLPTLKELTGIKSKPKHLLDGKSFAQQLRGEKKELNRFLFENLGGRMRVLKDSLLLTAEGLYNIKQDPGQKEDISIKFPEQKQLLQTKFDQWQQDLPEKPEVLPIQIGFSEKLPVILEASQADLFPPFQFRKDRRHTGIAYHSLYGWAHDWVDDWTKTEAYIGWPVEVKEASSYQVFMEYALDSVNQKVKLILEAGDQQFQIPDLKPFTPELLHDYDRVPRVVEAPARAWKAFKVGEIQLPKGKYDLKLKSVQIGGNKSIELKSILLKKKN